MTKEREAGAELVGDDPPAKIEAELVELLIPVANVGTAGCSRVDTRLTQRQYTALRRLFDGLQADNAVISLPGGEGPVRSQSDVVRWIMDQVADALKLQADDYVRVL